LIKIAVAETDDTFEKTFRFFVVEKKIFFEKKITE